MAELVKPGYLTAAELLVARHARVDAVQLPKSDLLEPEPFAAFDRLLTQIFGATIGFPLTRTRSPLVPILPKRVENRRATICPMTVP